METVAEHVIADPEATMAERARKTKRERCVHDEVDVALPVFHFLVGQTVELSGSGRSDLVSRRISLAATVSSPVLVFISVPTTPRISPSWVLKPA